MPTGTPSCESGPATPVVEMPTVAGTPATARRSRTPRGHLRRDIRVHRSVRGQQAGVHAEQGVLEFGAVGDDAAVHDRGGAGGADEFGHEHPAGQRLSDRDASSRAR